MQNQNSNLLTDTLFLASYFLRLQHPTLRLVLPCLITHFTTLEAIARDSCSEYAGNIDGILLLAKLACGQNHLSIRWRAAKSIMVLINENPDNAAVFLAIRGFRMLIECLPQLPQIPENYSDPMHSHFRNFLFYVVQICLAGATLLDHYCLSIVECMAVTLIRLPAIAVLTNPAEPFCQPIVQSVLS